MILIFIFKKSKLIYIINKIIIIGFKWSNLNIYLYMKTLNE